MIYCILWSRHKDPPSRPATVLPFTRDPRGHGHQRRRECGRQQRRGPHTPPRRPPGLNTSGRGLCFDTGFSTTSGKQPCFDAGLSRGCCFDGQPCLGKEHSSSTRHIQPNPAQPTAVLGCSFQFALVTRSNCGVAAKALQTRHHSSASPSVVCVAEALQRSKW